MDRIGPTFFEEENRVKNLVVRAISGAVLVALVVLSILLSSCYCFGVLFFAVMMLSLVEFYKMAEKIEGVSVDKWMGLAGGVVLYAAAFFVSFLGKSVTLFSVYALYVSVLMAFELFRGKQSPIQNLSATLLGHLYVSVPFVLFCLVEGATQQSKYLLLAFFVIIWASDTGAYLVGRFFGRHKMFERISPKKTWEGFAGGLISPWCRAIFFIVLRLSIPWNSPFGLRSPLESLCSACWATWWNPCLSVVSASRILEI